MAEREPRSKWPDGRTFALCLTHDVDRVDKSWWHCAHGFLKTRDPYHLRSLVTRSKERPFWNFEKIMALEDQLGVRSTFFFLNESKPLVPYRPSTYALSLGYYDINDPRVVDVIGELDAGGWEVGMHGSYDSYLSGELLSKEKIALETILDKKVLGVRQHFLNLEVPRTWELHQEVGFAYDASFGLCDRVDCREGRDLPFYPLGRGLLEIPLTIMDGPLFATSKDTEDAWSKCINLIDRTEQRGGLVTALWHNYTFNDQEHPGQIDVYRRVIEECKERGAWVATCEEISRWWNGKDDGLQG
jgi:peptidoglycan/xylan/chitin deacetylase (PgdA/CDA1 family)